MLYCGICGEKADTVHRVDTVNGVRWLCPNCMAKLRKIKKGKKQK